MDGYVDLALSNEEMNERQASNTALAETPKYPYGTSLSLDENILEKMDVDHSDWSVGDIFHLHALAKVTSISEHENQDGAKCCVTLQIIALKGESEDAEDNENEEHEFEDGSRVASEGGYLKYAPR